MKNKLRQQTGQAVVESVLLIVVLLALGRTVFSYIREQQLIQKMITQPWSYVSGMIECGTWQPCGLHGGPQPGVHPLSRSRAASLKPTP